MAEDFNVNINLHDTSPDQSTGDAELDALRRQFDEEAAEISKSMTSMLDSAHDALNSFRNTVQSQGGSAPPPITRGPSPASPGVGPPGGPLTGLPTPPGGPTPPGPLTNPWGLLGGGGLGVIALNQGLELLGKAVEFLEQLTSGVDELVTRIQPFSPEIQIQEALNELTFLRQNMEFANRLGPDVARIQALRAELTRSIQEIQTESFGRLLPLYESILVALNQIIDTIEIFTPGGISSIVAPQWLQDLIASVLGIERNTRPEQRSDPLAAIDQEIADFFTPAGGWQRVPPRTPDNP